MPRRNRLRRAPTSPSGLTSGQYWELTVGMLPAGERGFKDQSDRARAWWATRERLLAESRPFHRPIAFWELEQGYVPDCEKNGYESERAALIRLGLELTPQEQSILTLEKNINERKREN